jgi:Domain of unknown function (DUF4136)
MRRLTVTLILAAALGGCAALQTLRTEVSTYGDWPAGRLPGSYAFERLPSQQARAEAQAVLEAAARPALSAAGFSEVAPDEEPELRVQVGARTTRLDPAPWGLQIGVGNAWAWDRGPWWGPGWGLGWQTAPPRYEREVGLLIRDRASGQVLYEARAGHEGPAAADRRVVAALFAAALKDFPARGLSPRTVAVPLDPAAAPPQPSAR